MKKTGKVQGIAGKLPSFVYVQARRFIDDSSAPITFDHAVVNAKDEVEAGTRGYDTLFLRYQTKATEVESFEQAERRRVWPLTLLSNDYVIPSPF